MLPEVISDQAHPINRKNNLDLGNSGWQEIWKISIKQTLWVTPSYSDFLSIKSYGSNFKHHLVKMIIPRQCSYETETDLLPIHLSSSGSGATFPREPSPGQPVRRNVSLQHTLSIARCKPILLSSTLQRLTTCCVCLLDCTLVAARIFALFICVFPNIQLKAQNANRC